MDRCRDRIRLMRYPALSCAHPLGVAVDFFMREEDQNYNQAAHPCHEGISRVVGDRRFLEVFVYFKLF